MVILEEDWGGAIVMDVPEGKIELVNWSNWLEKRGELFCSVLYCLRTCLILFNCEAPALYFSKNAYVIFACSPCICFR